MGRGGGPFRGGFHVNRFGPGTSRERSPVKKILRNRFEDIESGIQPHPHRRGPPGRIRKPSRNHNVRMNGSLVGNQENGTSLNYSANLFPVANTELRGPNAAENPWLVGAFPDGCHNAGTVSAKMDSNSPWLPSASSNNHTREMQQRGWTSASQLLEKPFPPNLWESPSSYSSLQVDLWSPKPNNLSARMNSEYHANVTGRIQETLDPKTTGDLGPCSSSIVKEAAMQQNVRASLLLLSQTPQFCALPHPGGQFLNHTPEEVKAPPKPSLSKSLSATSMINHQRASMNLPSEAFHDPDGSVSMIPATNSSFPNQNVIFSQEGDNSGLVEVSKSSCVRRDRIHEQNILLQQTENGTERKSADVVRSQETPSTDRSGDSYELRFLEISDRLGLQVKCSPSMKISDSGQRLYCFSIELSRSVQTVTAQGPYLATIEEAREQAYKEACNLAYDSFSPKCETPLPNNRNTGDTGAEPQRLNLLEQRPDLRPAEHCRGTKLVEGTDTSIFKNYRSTNPFTLKEHSERGVQIVKPGLLPTPSKPQKAPLLETPTLNPRDAVSVVKNQYEDRFKDYMDALHMQCWLKLNYKNEPRSRRLLSVTVEVQSYDQKFHEFYVGSYSETEEIAKESAFEIACKNLERRFPSALEHLSREIVPPSQRAFMDLRSTLGLTVRFLPEIKLDLHNRQKYSYTIEFCRGDRNLPEAVHSEFWANEADAKERAFKLAVERIHYLHGPELNALNKKKTCRPSSPSVPTDSTANSAPPCARPFNPHSQGPRQQALVAPLIHSLQKPNPSSSVGSASAGQSKSQQSRFEELAGLLNTDYKVRKIPQFDGGHKVYAFEITFQGKHGGRVQQKIMGEYFWDEVAARESAFKHAGEQLRCIYGY